MTFLSNRQYLQCLRLVASLAIFFSICSPTTDAQPWLRRPIVSSENSSTDTHDFKSLQKRFNEYWSERNPGADESENRAEGGYQQFRRWEWFMEPRTFPSGIGFDPEALFKETRRYKTSRLLRTSRQITANWQEIGPTIIPSGGGGSGRINVVRVHPSNNSVLYIGTASGGIWKSVNYGQTWTPLSDFLPSISIADIAINPRYPDSVYIATGDGYGYETGGGFWGGTYSAGVMVSPDGGITWHPTGLSFIQSNSMIIQRLVIKPDEPNILLASSRGGLFRSSNGGVTWSMVRAGQHFDIEFHTSRPDTIFATDDNNLLWSTNRGVTWTVRKTNLCAGRLSLALTAANPDRLYMVCEDQRFYRSDDLGVTLQQLTDPVDASFYGYYDAVLSASPTNPDMVMCAGLEMVQSFDGGNSWNQVGSNVHVDHHYIEHQPNSGNVIYSCNDGGIYRSSSVGSGWQDISSNLGIKQYYRMAQSATDPGLIFGGAQDNGTDRLVSGTWVRVLGGDGMDCMVDPVNDQIVYASYQYGAMRRSYNRGTSFTDIAPSSGSWVTPFAMHPVNPSIIYAGCEKVYRSVDRGNNWDTLSGAIFGADLISLEVSPADPDHLYAATHDLIMHTSDAGGSWVNVSAGLPVGGAALTAIATSPDNPLKVWVTFSGYITGTKVFFSADGGANWTNVSGSLPNLPVNCIIIQRNSSDACYIGTDMGVFYTDSTMNDWEPFIDRLPNVIISDLDIHYATGKIRAATYGRGIWESDVYVPLPTTTDELTDKSSFTCYPNPASSGSMLRCEACVPGDQLKVLDGLGKVVMEKYFSSKELYLDLTSFSQGIYQLEVTKSNKVIGTAKLIRQ